MQPSKVINELINKINNTVNVLSIPAEDIPGGLFTFQVDAFKWIRTGKYLNAGSVVYLVTNKETNESGEYLVSVRLIEGTYVAPETIEIPFPVYFHGTIRMVNNEVTMINNTSNKTPLMYLENFRGVDENEITNRIKYEVPLRLFFLDEANYNDWLTDDYDTEVIEPMQELVKEFQRVVNNNKHLIDSRGVFSGYPVFKFATTDSNGYLKNLFTDDLSGYALEFDLKFINQENCKTIKFK